MTAQQPMRCTQGSVLDLGMFFMPKTNTKWYLVSNTIYQYPFKFIYSLIPSTLLMLIPIFWVLQNFQWTCPARLYKSITCTGPGDTLTSWLFQDVLLKSAPIALYHEVYSEQLARWGGCFEAVFTFYIRLCVVTAK